MTRIQALRILNIALLLMMAFQIFSGLRPMAVPYVVHQDLGILIGAGILLHIILNWNWIRINILRLR